MKRRLMDGYWFFGHGASGKEDNTMRRLLLVVNIFVISCLLSMATAGASFAAYSFTHLYLAPAYGINDAGAVVGGGGGSFYIYDGSSYTYLNVPGANQHTAWDISNTGVVAGNYWDGTHWQAFTYDGSSFSYLNAPGALTTVALGINDAGIIAGYYADSTGYHGFTYDGISYSTLDVSGASETKIIDINNMGIVTGSYWSVVSGTGTHRGYVYDGSSFTYLGVPGATHTIAHGINDKGVIVGYYVDSTGNHGFTYDGTSYATLDVPGASETILIGINNAGDIVGWYKDTTGNHGFIATPSGTGNGAPAALPRTGQTGCWDETGMPVECAGTGQDGDIRAGIAWPVPRFVDNGDGTFTDDLTGLMWAQDGNVMLGRDPSFDSDGTPGDGFVTWQHALDYVNLLNSGAYLGYADWRLPNIIELESLKDLDQENNASWLRSQGFLNVPYFELWSSTTLAGSLTDWAWYVSMNTVHKHVQPKYQAYGVWPVRGESAGAIALPRTGQQACYDEAGAVIECAGTGQDGELQKGVPWPAPRFTDNADGTVSDNLTGLMWLKDANCISTIGYDPDSTGDGRVSWNNALDFASDVNSGVHNISSCASYSAAYSDWRLPNRNEIQSLADASQYLPALPSGHPFSNVPYNYFWTSTTVSHNFLTNFAWYHNINSGDTAVLEKDSLLRAWLVRGGTVSLPELCDGVDNDGDGQIDEGFPDSDGDGQADCVDVCLFDPDNDADGDGLCADVDACPAEDSTGFDADGDGCIDSLGGLANVVSTLVEEGVISPELENSLLSKIQNAERSATKENICAAVNQLGALKNQINAQRGNKISDEAADLLIAYADNVIASLLNQLPPGESC